MICNLLDKITEYLTPKQAILLMATFEKAGMEWVKRAEVIGGLACFSTTDSKCVNLATSRLLLLGYLSAVNKADSTYGRSKWIQVTEDGRKFLNEVYAAGRGKGVRV
jgi:hypothetical protein